MMSKLRYWFRPQVIISIHGPDGLIETIVCPPPWRVRLDGLLLRLRAPLAALWRVCAPQGGRRETGSESRSGAVAERSASAVAAAPATRRSARQGGRS